MSDYSSDNSFYRLSPFIQEFIYRKGWKELRDVQVKAADVLFDTTDHLLIMSGTASGKTEAAFLPILTDLMQNPAAGIGVIYIGPLKALINDQFARLDELLNESGIRVQSWHGDIDQSRKQKFLQNPSGVLQITPESLEAMLILRHKDISRLFGNVRYVVIDEVHAFMQADRGRQILCQLQRLQIVQKELPRRVGLSATLGDPEGAKLWLAATTGRNVSVISDAIKPREVHLALWHYTARPANYEEQLDRAIKSGDAASIAAVEATDADHQAMLYQIYEQTQGKKSIIFTNSRSDAEMIITGVREVAERNHGTDIYHVHHGNISAPLRTAAEAAMQAEGQPACTSATVTLELGIDIGRLDQVLQLNATYTVSSFVQRLGRAGRRDTPPQMGFYHEEQPIDEQTHPGDHFPWELIQMIAIIQLYVEERWIEPAESTQLPFSLLFHQTLSVLTTFTELTPAALAERVLSLPPFQHVTQDHYRILLRHMLAQRYLEQTETGTLIVGLTAEKIVGNYRFYAVFPDEDSYSVRDGSREIGTIQHVPPVDSVFRLAGFAWRAKEINEKRKTILVERARSRAVSAWLGNGGVIHKRVLERMHKVLTETVSYAYAQPNAAARLQEARTLASRYKLGLQPDTPSIVPLGGNKLLYFPWQGSRIFNTLLLMLKQREIGIGYVNAPYFIELDGLPTEADLVQLLRDVAANPPTLAHLTDQIVAAELNRNKFDPYLPETLRREAYGVNELAYANTLDMLRAQYNVDAHNAPSS